jgi:hypothetical protein
MNLSLVQLDYFTVYISTQLHIPYFYIYSYNGTKPRMEAP